MTKRNDRVLALHGTYNALDTTVSDGTLMTRAGSGGWERESPDEGGPNGRPNPSLRMAVAPRCARAGKKGHVCSTNEIKLIFSFAPTAFACMPKSRDNVYHRTRVEVNPAITRMAAESPGECHPTWRPEAMAEETKGYAQSIDMDMLMHACDK